MGEKPRRQRDQRLRFLGLQIKTTSPSSSFLRKRGGRVEGSPPRKRRLFHFLMWPLGLPYQSLFPHSFFRQSHISCWQSSSSEGGKKKKKKKKQLSGGKEEEGETPPKERNGGRGVRSQLNAPFLLLLPTQPLYVLLSRQDSPRTMEWPLVGENTHTHPTHRGRKG